QSCPASRSRPRKADDQTTGCPAWSRLCVSSSNPSRPTPVPVCRSSSSFTVKVRAISPTAASLLYLPRPLALQLEQLEEVEQGGGVCSRPQSLPGAPLAQRGRERLPHLLTQQTDGSDGPFRLPAASVEPLGQRHQLAALQPVHRVPGARPQRF